MATKSCFSLYYSCLLAFFFFSKSGIYNPLSLSPLSHLLYKLQVKNLLPVIVSLYADGLKVSEVYSYEEDKDMYDVPIALVVSKEPLLVSVG